MEGKAPAAVPTSGGSSSSGWRAVLGKRVAISPAQHDCLADEVGAALWDHHQIICASIHPSPAGALCHIHATESWASVPTCNCLQHSRMCICLLGASPAKT